MGVGKSATWRQERVPRGSRRLPRGGLRAYPCGLPTQVDVNDENARSEEVQPSSAQTQEDRIYDAQLIKRHIRLVVFCGEPEGRLHRHEPRRKGTGARAPACGRGD